MTTCVAAWTGKHYAIATDSQLNMGSCIVQDNCNKLFEIGNLRVGFAGSYWMFTHFKAMFFDLDERLLRELFDKTVFANKLKSDGVFKECVLPLVLGQGRIKMDPDEIEMGLHVVWSILESHLKQRQLENSTQNPEDNSYGCQLLVVCRHGAYEITPEGNIIRKNLSFIGSGSNYVHGAVLALTNSQDLSEADAKVTLMKKEEVSELVTRLVEIAGAIDTDTNTKVSTFVGKI